jgi:hypothetical protein
MIKWMQTSFGNDVNAASDYIWRSLSDTSTPSVIWEMLVERGGDEITPDTVRAVAEDILYMERDEDGDFGDSV